jgi:hypothetical protein
MATVVSFPEHGEAFLDARGDGRAMRVTWHQEVGTVVFSLWRGDTCTGSFRLSADDVPALLAMLAGGLATALDQPVGSAAARSKARGSGASTSPGSIAR